MPANYPRKLEYKPCPFCGGRGEWKHHVKWNQHYIKCAECKASTDRYASADEAVEAWESRT